MEYKVITASEARKITENSEFMKKSIYKWIKEEASRNRNKMYVTSEDFDESLLTSFITELKNEGYFIEKDDITYIISW